MRKTFSFILVCIFAFLVSSIAQAETCVTCHEPIKSAVRDSTISATQVDALRLITPLPHAGHEGKGRGYNSLFKKEGAFYLCPSV